MNAAVSRPDARTPSTRSDPIPSRPTADAGSDAGRAPPPRWRVVARWIAAAVFLVLGVAGLFLPFLQGILFLVVAVALAAPDVPVARRLMVAALRRWPAVRRRLPTRLRRLSRPERSPEDGA